MNNSRFRKVRKWGNSLVVIFSKSDVKDLNIKDGDMADVSDMLILSKELYDFKHGDKKDDDTN